ncbi:MAG: class I SAM-dependent methyltransferase [Microgenomates group bacterium]
MIALLYALLLLVFVVIVIFSFPQFSPIPYFPSNKKDLPHILHALDIRGDQTIVDLGAGDGIIIFEAAQQAFLKKLATQFYAVEINPILLLILHIRRLLHPNRNNIHIIKRDMFTMSYDDILDCRNATFYLYISPWFIEKTVTNITKQVKKFVLVSYFYRVSCLPEHKEIMVKGVHSLYTYR